MTVQEPIKTFFERSRGAAQAFLRSAVVVDDEPFVEERAAPVDEMSDNLAEDPTLEGLPVAQPPAAQATDGNRLDVDVVARAFAQLGIVCAVIRPDPKSEPDAAVLGAIAGADLVVLDWQMFRDEGLRARRWVGELARARSSSWMLVAIYTQSADLDGIADQIEEVLRDAVGDVTREGQTLRAAGVAVHVFAKVTELGNSPGAVAPGDLPARLVEAFAESTSGLLRNAALRGLSALRDATLEILRKFDGEIDVGFAAQRLMLDQPRDAEDQAVALLAAEFSAALRGAGIEAEVDADAVRSWLEGLGRSSDEIITKDLWRKIFTVGVEKERFSCLIAMLHDGIATLEVNGIRAGLTSHGHKSAYELFDPTRSSANARFAHLMSVESRYGNGPPVLGLGTLLEGDGRFWMCLQPACDSLRLTEATRFPLVPLTQTDTPPFDVIIMGEVVPKLYSTAIKFRDLEARIFSPDASAGRVLAEGDGDPWHFSDAEGVKYRWCGDLREQHAQRFAAQFAAHLGRLGLDESEWQRLSARRRP